MVHASHQVSWITKENPESQVKAWSLVHSLTSSVAKFLLNLLMNKELPRDRFYLSAEFNGKILSSSTAIKYL